MNPTLTGLLHGDAGAGKSWLAGTAPLPLLILDAEGRSRYIPGGPKIMWDPRTEDPPQYDGTWTQCIVNVTEFDIMSRAYQWLQSGRHQFRSVDIDSLMECQKKYIDRLVGMNALEMQDWGSVLRHLESMVRSYRDLVLEPTNTVDCVIVVVGTTVGENGRHEPLLQGALRKTIPYFMDFVGYLYVTHEADGRLQRNLLVQPTPTIVAKDGTGLLGGPAIAEPNITSLYERLA
jgi:hypothetical protein